MFSFTTPSPLIFKRTFLLTHLAVLCRRSPALVPAQRGSARLACPFFQLAFLYTDGHHAVCNCNHSLLIIQEQIYIPPPPSHFRQDNLLGKHLGTFPFSYNFIFCSHHHTPPTPPRQVETWSPS